MGIDSSPIETLFGILREATIEPDNQDGLSHAEPSQHQCANGGYGPGIQYLVRLADPIGVPLHDNTIDESTHVSSFAYCYCRT